MLPLSLLKYSLFILALALDNENVILNINVEKISITDLPSGHDRLFVYDKGFTYLDPEETTFYRKYSPPNQYIPTHFRVYWIVKKVPNEILQDQNLESMLGFNLSWYFSGAEVQQANRLYDTQNFTR